MNDDDPWLRGVAKLWQSFKDAVAPRVSIRESIRRDNIRSLRENAPYVHSAGISKHERDSLEVHRLRIASNDTYFDNFKRTVAWWE